MDVALACLPARGATGHMEQAQATLRDLRMKLQRLQKQAARIRTAAQVVHSPTMLLRLRAVLLYVLCDSMQWTLLLLRPGARLIVVMDVCPAHVAPAVLVGARRLQIDIVLVPARLTWLLQLLDTHVFAQLKREMRTEVWAAKQRQADGALSAPEHLQALLEATSKVLTRRSWSHFFPRVGLDGSTDALRPGLRDLVQDEDLSAKPPTESELATVLGAHRTNIGHVYRLLVPRQKNEAGMQSQEETGSAGERTATPEEADPILAPLLPGSVVSRSSGAAPQNAFAAPDVTRLVPRGRRLLPCIRNLQILPTMPDAREHRMATRSQKRALLEGVVGAEKRSRAD